MSWHPSDTTLLIRPYFLYVRLLREDVGRCTFASHCAPAFLPDACHHRTLYHCWLRSTGEGGIFSSLALIAFLLSTASLQGSIQSAHSKVPKGCLCHFCSRSIISRHHTDGEILAWSLPFPSGEGFASSFRMAIFYSSSISAFKSFPYALMKQFLLCAPMPSVFMTFGYYGFCFIFSLQS